MFRALFVLANLSNFSKNIGVDTESKCEKSTTARHTGFPDGITVFK